ncbi:TonB-dependent receptor [Phenylobacterium sp.]|uniref:TonB-dependent receptor n=1 Tax=Phenylobacterium sp. TaxID=1871053 RepID=UPI00289F36FA|nr:TonB-dependent receptor [Phenylobacterium sp.]
MLGLAAPANAQDEISVEEVVVTGSFIAGTPENAALPVNVIGQDEMQKQGSPSTVDLLKSIPAVSGVLGEANQYAAAQSTGVGNVNLRGLGSERTLVLMNGRRMAISPGAIYVDTNMIPSAAIGRVEVLKDGAAATYGSDAVAGVVNFITRKNLNGLEVSGGYSFIDGSDGEYNLNAAYGWQGERGDILLTAGYRKRNQLPVTERDFAMRSLEDNPQGGWSSFGNPGLYLTSANGGVTYTNPLLDPGCATISGPATASGCQFQFVGFNNLIEEEDHWQLYGEINFELTEKTKFHAEVLYAAHDVAQEHSSPSYPPNNYPTSALTGKVQGNGFFIPSANPGLQALLGQMTPAQAAAAANGLFTTVAWRPIGVGGNDLFGGGAKHDRRYFETYRISAGLKGEFDVAGGIGWDAAVTYMDSNSDVATSDILVGKLQRAMMGLGGANCQGTTPGANGCLWFNPFSTGVEGNVIDGRTNPGYVASTANSREVLDYIFGEYGYKQRSRIFTADLVFNGQVEAVDLGAGPLAWAAGAQYRWSGVERQNNDDTNIAVSPCADSSVNPGATCVAQNGPFSFFGALADYDLDYSVGAAFVEAQMPFTDSLTGTLAIRYEDYGGNIGATTNPKVALKWQATDWLAFRVSAGSTFRAPPQTQIAATATTNLSYTTAAGGYRAYDLWGNPNLEPEKAKTINLGALFDFGDFRASVDYWSFDFEGPIRAESGSQIVNAIFPNGSAGANNCGNPAYAALQDRISFTGACSAGAINRVRQYYVNGPDVKTSGIDVSANYTARDVFGGDMNFGVDVTYVIEYVVAQNTIEGVVTAPETDYVGTMDYLGYGSQPQWKGSAFAEYTRGEHNVRWTVRYVDDMVDTRGGTSTFATNQNGRKIDAFVTHDLAYRVFLPWETTLTASVINVLDEDPPFARLDLSYDPFTANPLGRYYKLGVTKKF